MRYRDQLVANLRLALASARSHADLAQVRQRVDDWLDHMLAALEPLRAWAAGRESFVQGNLQALAARLRDCREHDGTTVADVSSAVDRLVRRSGPEDAAILDRLRSDRHELVNRAEALQAESTLRRSLSRALRAALRTNARLGGDWRADLRKRSVRGLPSVSELEQWLERATAGQGSRPLRKHIRSRVDHVVLVDDDPHHRALMRWAVDQATAGRMPLEVREFSNVCDAECFLEDGESTRRILLVTDLGLPRWSDGRDLADENRGREMVTRWAPTHPTIVVTAHGRLYDEFKAMPHWNGPCGPDGFVPKVPGWEEELAAVLRRSLHPAPLQESVLDILTCTGKSIRIDGIEVDLPPTAFWWLDTLAREEGARRSLERFTRRGSPGHAPRYKSLREFGQSLIMSGVLALPDDTEVFWDNLRRNHGKQVATLNRAVEAALADAGARYAGSLVMAAERRQARHDVDWTALRYRIACRQVRRWTTLTDYLEHRPTDEEFRVLLVEDDPAWRAQLRADLEETLSPRLHEATDAHEALRAARTFRPHAIVLDLQLAGDREAGRLSGLELREELHRMLGPVPVICLSGYLDAAVRRRLQSIPSHLPEGSQRQDREVQGRAFDVVEKRGHPQDESQRVLRFLLECHTARRRSRLLSAQGEASYHQVVVARETGHSFAVDGQVVSFAPPRVARSGPEAALAHAVLVCLAEADNVWMERRALMARLILAGRLGVGGRDFNQKMTRAILALRKAIATAMGPECSLEVIEGNNPYRLRGHVRLVEDAGR